MYLRLRYEDVRAVLALVDADGDGFAEMHLRVAQGLVSPIGVALHGTSLYVGESPHIRRFPAIKQQLESGAMCAPQAP